jgi:hypothetical protein
VSGSISCMRQDAMSETMTAFHSAPPSVAQKSQFFAPTFWCRSSSSEGLCRLPDYAAWEPRGRRAYAAEEPGPVQTRHSPPGRLSGLAMMPEKERRHVGATFTDGIRCPS